MNRIVNERTAFAGLVLALGGIAPNLFPAAQAGIASLSWLGTHVLLPSFVLLVLVTTVAGLRGHRRLVRRVVLGASAGLIATLGLEAVRATSFHLGGMPGDMPRLLGVLLTDRFMLGPSPLSDVLGYAYHFYNGLCFGLIFAVLLGRRSTWWALAYAQAIGLGFLLSPAVKALGIGFMGSAMPAMPLTVVLAHLVYGLVLGVLLRRWLQDDGWLLSPPRRGALVQDETDFHLQ